MFIMYLKHEPVGWGFTHYHINHERVYVFYKYEGIVFRRGLYIGSKTYYTVIIYPLFKIFMRVYVFYKYNWVKSAIYLKVLTQAIKIDKTISPQ